MRAIIRTLLVGLMMASLVGCGAYKYENPKFFGINDYIWWNLSQHQRSEVVANMTSPTVRSVNKDGFRECLNTCVPKNGSDSTGVNKWCFDKCLKKITPVERFSDPSTAY